MRSMKKALPLVAAVAVALAAGVVIGRWSPRAQPPVAAPTTPAAPAAQKPVPVRTAAVQSVDFARSLAAVGSLRSDESVMLRPEVAGRIARLPFQEGQPVKRGQLLVQLDDAVARAELDQARANLSLAQSQNKRASSLQAEGFISQQARDEAGSNLKVQQAAVALAQARLDKMAIRAPFDGVVGLRGVSVGDYVDVGRDLAPLETIDPLKVDFRVPELYLGRVRVGQSLSLHFDALPGQSSPGEVIAVSPLVDAGGRSVLLRAQVPNPSGALRPGMFARVQLMVENTQALVVPESALSPSGAQQFVYRVAGGHAQRVPVGIGERREGRVEILSGLAAGERVVVAGLQRITDGAPVTETPAAQPDAPAPDTPASTVTDPVPASDALVPEPATS
ncbi:Probable RND efflux membrane fusion protein [plant metagenome]|uniref:Probable RND efflux membrane fusion protein n=2 Tax=plant metagenome TaxID=1297885 RepID=A0A484SWV1_9ZZZZ